MVITSGCAAAHDVAARRDVDTPAEPRATEARDVAQASSFSGGCARQTGLQCGDGVDDLEFWRADFGDGESVYLGVGRVSAIAFVIPWRDLLSIEYGLWSMVDGPPRAPSPGWFESQRSRTGYYRTCIDREDDTIFADNVARYQPLASLVDGHFHLRRVHGELGPELTRVGDDDPELVALVCGAPDLPTFEVAFGHRRPETWPGPGRAHPPWPRQGRADEHAQ